MLIVVEASDPVHATRWRSMVAEWPGEVLLCDATREGLGVAVRSARVSVHRRNPPMLLGLAGAWNIGLRYGRHPWVVVVHESAVIAKPRAFARLLIEMSDDGDGLVRFGSGWSCCAIRSDAVRRVGYFDENLWPDAGVGEDFDRRCRLAGLSWQTIVDDAAVWRPAPFGAECDAYYRAKWGGQPGAERHLTPFGDPALEVASWPKQGTARSWMDRTGRDRRVLVTDPVDARRLLD